MNERFIELEGIRNFRELGSIVRKDGKHLPLQRFYRCGNLHRLSEENQLLLKGQFHVVRIIDLRSKDEVNNAPDPEIPGVEWHHVPFLPGINNGVSSQNLTRIQRVLRHREMTETYYQMGSDPWTLHQIAKAIHLCLELPEGAVLWHCSAGKDRTGILAYLLLRLFGFSDKEAFDDYLLTNEHAIGYAKEMKQKALDDLGDIKAAEKVYRMFIVDRKYLNSFKKGVTDSCGSIFGFFHKYCGFSNKDIANIRSLFLD